MRQVSVSEASRRFSKLLSEVAQGGDIVITRRGKPVARLSPVIGPKTGKQREAAIKRMIKLMERGVNLGGVRATRDEMHER